MGDVNLEVAGVLLDMAALAGDSQRGWGYTRAAKAVLRLDRHITPLIHANTFKAVPGIGPTTDRIAREVIHDGHSTFVERAIQEAGKEEDVRRLRGLRHWDQVFEVAARREVAIEIDGSWDRQDMHYELASRALGKGCIFALDSDAHSHPELDFIDIAIAHARLAGIPQERIINYWTEAKFLKWAKGAWDR